MKDWKGNRKTTFVQLGASNHSDHERETNDFYATDPNSLSIFLQALKRDKIELHHNIWECACGEGHLSKVLMSNGYQVDSSDLIDRGFGLTGINFFDINNELGHSIKRDILTNPPYRYAKEFVEHAMNILDIGCYCIMYLKIQFLEGKARRTLFEKYPPQYVYINSERQACYINGSIDKKMSSATCYCWFVWQKGFQGEPTIRWI